MKKIRDYLIFYVKFILRKILNSRPWAKELKFYDFFFF